MRFLDTLKSMSPFRPASTQQQPPQQQQNNAAAGGSPNSTTATPTAQHEPSLIPQHSPSARHQKFALSNEALTAVAGDHSIVSAAESVADSQASILSRSPSPPPPLLSVSPPKPQAVASSALKGASHTASSLSPPAPPAGASSSSTSSLSNVSKPISATSASNATAAAATAAAALKTSTATASASANTNIKPSFRATGISPKPEFPQFSPATEEILKRAKAAQAARAGDTGYEAAREHVLNTVVTSDRLAAQPLTPLPSARGRARGRGGVTNGSGRGRGKAPPQNGTGAGADGSGSPLGLGNETTGSGRGRGRGRGAGRGRGRGGGKGGKRKRDDSEEETDSDSDGSSNYTPIATETKSGRKVNKPAQFVPTLPSPTGAPKKRKTTNTLTPKKAEASVCKACQRGNSPSSNMIVYCDGCNTPYHQYCHDPPIDREVVQVPDMEWFCKDCKKSQELAQFGLEALVPGPDLLLEEKQAYFATLPQSHLISLLCYATAVHPTLPLFHHDTQARLEAAGVPTAHLTLSTLNGTSKHSLLQTSFPRTPFSGLGQAQPSTSHSINPASHSHTNVHNTNFVSDAANGPNTPPLQLLADESREDDHYDDPTALHFPRPGNGLAARVMRPESEDLQWLVDDNLEVFSHVYQKDHDGDGLEGDSVAGADGMDLNS